MGKTAFQQVSRDFSINVTASNGLAGSGQGGTQSTGGFGQSDPDVIVFTNGRGTGVKTAEDAYSADDIARLLYLIEEEKLAGDIYEAFYDQTGLKIFDNIAASEDSHFAALLAQAEMLALDLTEILAQPAGIYTDPELQALYDTLLAQGSVSATAALEVGVLIEETDLTDLAEAVESVVGSSLATTYGSLLDGSQTHLDALETLLTAGA